MKKGNGEKRKRIQKREREMEEEGIGRTMGNEEGRKGREEGKWGI